MATSTGAEDDRARRKIVGINRETVTNITSTDFPGHHVGEDHTWSLQKFKDGLNVEFHQNEQTEASFSVIGIDASIANAFRRILLAEIPTLAIENVYVLIPLTGALEGMKWLKWYIAPNAEQNFKGMERSDYNTIVFHLQAKCTPNPDAPPDATDPGVKHINGHVYSSQIEWQPQGRQVEHFKDGPIRPVSERILIAKMRPGQELDVTMHAHLGVGKDHAKFSPVATATYRLLPTIQITKPILGADAVKFQQCFSKGVIDLERVTASDAASSNKAYEGREGDEKAVVKNPFNDTVSRECLRHDEFKGKVKLGRQQDHFIFNIESTGQFPSDTLFLDSVAVLKLKAQRLLQAIDEMNS
ncbi:DNA-directed RNA polymerases I and III subunit RPAC1 [Cyphellophora attinorum]|uniref:DNA-directed RNA polymerases I and III subunit RPAC1 n=1 Tax=Cyphellophora attinorum TaxID=1664694 RepID=A0A0N0NRC6_9EURO|nr:DNA-directed RNA polymerases I and III subunit RPAC1 [Phialophora attinorum]KPI44938.1 DNA-directed RNA polymerases I and III subunit RPAC1 [Phialophora attinorum]